MLVGTTPTSHFSGPAAMKSSRFSSPLRLHEDPKGLQDRKTSSRSEEVFRAFHEEREVGVGLDRNRSANRVLDMTRCRSQHPDRRARATAP